MRDIEGIAQLEPTIGGDGKNFKLILKGNDEIVNAGTIEVGSEINQHGLSAGGDIKGPLGAKN
jgi:hypothetical protein